MRRAFDMYGDDSDGQQFKYLNIFARIEGCEKWTKVRRTLSKNKDEQYNPDAPAAAASAGRPELGQKKLKELKKSGHPSDRLQASFEKCWADARAHIAGRDTKYDARWKEMLANQGTRIALLQTISAAKKRNTNLAFLIGRNDAAMDEETMAWYDAHRQAILRPPSTASSSLRRCPLRGRRNFAARGAGRHRRRACCSLVSVSIAGLWLIRSPNLCDAFV
jgi:hypothetical protein